MSDSGAPSMTGKHPIIKVRIEYGQDGQPPMTRDSLIFAARQLVRDMPGVVVGEVPPLVDDTQHGKFLYEMGWNAAIAAMLANGENTDGR